MEDILNIIGILTAIIGTWLFAYDLIWGYRKRVLIDQINVKLKTQQNQHAWMKQMINKLSKPPYTDAEIEAEHKKNDNDNLPIIESMEKQIEKLGDFSYIAANLAVIGLIIMTIGALLQIAAIIFFKPLASL